MSSSNVFGLDIQIIMSETYCRCQGVAESRVQGANNVPDLPITNIEIHALARELLAAYVSGGTIAVPLSARDENFELNAAYSIEAEFARLRIESGRTTAGLKVGY